MKGSKSLISGIFLILFSFNLFSQTIQYGDSTAYYQYIAKKELDSANYRKVVFLINKARKEGFRSYKLLEPRAIAYYKLYQTKKAFLDIEQLILIEDVFKDISPLVALYYINQELPNKANTTLINSYNLDKYAFFNSLPLINQRDLNIIIQNIDNGFSNEEFEKHLYPIKAMINYTFKNYNDAYTDLVTALELDSENGLLHFLLGEIKLERKEYISALSYYNSAIFYKEASTQTFKKRAIAKGFMNDFNGAINDYNYILELEPNNHEIYYLRAIAKNYLSDYNGAINDLNKAIGLNDTFASAYNYRGIVYINLDDYTSALFDFNQTLILNPNHPFTHNNIGLALYKTGQFNKAIEFFTKAISLDSKHADPYYNRGKLILERNDYKKAKPDIIKTLELNHHNPDAHFLLALIYIQEKKNEKKKRPRLRLDDMICEELKIASEMNHSKATELFNETCQKIEEEESEEEFMEEY